MEKFSYTKEIIDDVLLVKLVGTIDEDCYLKDIFINSQKRLAIDVSGITRINSCGIRTWVNVMELLTQSHNVLFIECAPVVIRQFNMISNFGARGVVQSFLLPYFCEKCNQEFLFRADTREFLLQQQPLKAPLYYCSDCNGRLEFDDIEAKYFYFLTQYKK